MSKWCDTCYRNELADEWKSCSSDCPVFGKSFDELAKVVIEKERLKSVLEDLKYMAKSVDAYEDSVYADYRNLAESYKREIVDTLIELEI